jgi:hypothetical protein
MILESFEREMVEQNIRNTKKFIRFQLIIFIIFFSCMLSLCFLAIKGALLSDGFVLLGSFIASSIFTLGELLMNYREHKNLLRERSFMNLNKKTNSTIETILSQNIRAAGRSFK